MRRGIKVALFVVGSLVGVFLATLLVFTALEYRPDPVIRLDNLHDAPAERPAPWALSIASWNIGYCGLDAQTDFFMDGGERSRPRSRDAVETALSAVEDQVAALASDVLFLQEVDRASARSFDIDQFSAIAGRLKGYAAWFAPNFDVSFVPTPITSPIGRVHSGLAVASRYAATSAERHQLPGDFAWPVRIFHLKRCALVVTLPSPIEGRSWVLVNLHLTAFDKEGKVRRQQLDHLRELMLERYEEGHFVVLGGDWNNRFPGVGMDDFGPYTTPRERLMWAGPIPEGWTPEGWQWAMDSSVPTVRSNETGYVEGGTFRTVIDGFLLSPNLEIVDVGGLDLGFAHSDHNPVRMQVRIRASAVGQPSPP